MRRPYAVPGINTDNIDYVLLDDGAKKAKTDLAKRFNNDFRIRRRYPAPPPFTLATDGSVPQRGTAARPAGAAMLFENRDAARVLGQATVLVSPHACSFSAEMAAAEAGLRLLLDSVPHGSAAEWIVDSLSIASALRRGPLRQRDADMERLWSMLLELTAKDISLTIIFVYSHVGVEVNEAVDKLAMLTSTTPPAQEPKITHWWKDHARQMKNSHTAIWDRDIFQGCSGAALIRRELGPANPKFVGRSRGGIGNLRDLARLRVGLHWKLGSFDHGTNADCPRCGAAVMGRGGTAVLHLFSCPSSDAKALRQRFKLADTPASLWGDTIGALRYFYAFLQEPTQVVNPAPE
jgi:ribonuclease HI